MNFFVNADGSEYILDIEKKRCSKCGELLPLSEFAACSGGNYKRTECRACTRKLENERKQLRDKYGNPPLDYICPICGRTEEECKNEGSKKSSAFVIDHCHITGKFRGWLCHTCNRIIGGVEKVGGVVKIQSYLDNAYDVTDNIWEMG